MTGEASFAEVNGVALRYVLDGAGPGVTVLVHEMGGTLESWDAVVPSLSPGRVIRYDTRGAGLSEKIRGVTTIEAMSLDLMALLDHLGVVGPVTLAGCAVGAATALHFAGSFPERCHGVLAMAPATSVPAERRAAVLEQADQVERDGMRSVVDASLDAVYPTHLRQDERAFEAFRARWLGTDPVSYAAIYRMLAGMDIAPILPRLRCPVTVAAGTLDPFRPPALVERVARQIPGARFETLECGHLMPVQAPASVARLLNDCRPK